jgi:peroxiredoxin Q/BCP
MLRVGDKAPGFSLPSDSGKPVKLSDYKDSTLVLYFFPKADTPG